MRALSMCVRACVRAYVCVCVRARTRILIVFLATVRMCKLCIRYVSEYVHTF